MEDQVKWLKKSRAIRGSPRRATRDSPGKTRKKKPRKTNPQSSGPGSQPASPIPELELKEEDLRAAEKKTLTSKAVLTSRGTIRWTVLTFSNNSRIIF